MPERGQLPVENGKHTRLGGMKDQVVTTVITVDHAHCRRVGRNVRPEPIEHTLQVRDAAGIGIGRILSGPTGNLPLEVAARFPVIAQPCSDGIDIVQAGQSFATGASPAFGLFILLNARTIRKMAKATMTKLRMRVMKLP